MKKRYITLNKKWKEILFAASGFGPNLLMVILGGYFTDAVNPAALNAGDLQAIGTACYVLPALFPILWALSKAFDGIIDIPLAHLTDSLKSKFGKRRPLIAISFIPMVLSFVLVWIPIAGESAFGSVETARIINTIWICAWALVFFTTYTLSLITYYGSLSTVCYDDSQRLRVSSFKSFFDTISYCLAYALVPVILGALQIHIDKLVFALVPLMVTMLIPLFMIKEGEKFEKKAIEEGYDIVPLSEEKPVRLFESIKLTFTNKPFLKWCLVNCCSFFGLQMFLSSMNALIKGGMGLNDGQMAILNTFAFAPVPIMLYLFNKLKAKKGIRFAYQTCLLSFAICIFSFVLGSNFVLGSSEDVVLTKIIIGVIGGIIGSWAIGSFFMMPYLIPAQISSVEEKLTGKNHSAMYFAAQAVSTSIIGALASGVVYENIKMMFISKAAPGVIFAENYDQAAELFNVATKNVFNLGTLLVPVFVSVFCILGFIVSFFMPKNFSPKEVAKDLGLEKEYEENKHLFPAEDTKPYETESLIVNIALYILSGTLFGFIWQYSILRNISRVSNFKHPKLHFVLGLLFFGLFGYLGVSFFIASRHFYKECKTRGVKCVDLSILHLILGLCGLNFVSLIILQHQLNKLHGNL